MAHDLRAAVDACLQKLTFRLRIPEQLPGGYQLSGLEPTEAGDGVMLRYVHGDASAKIFVRPSIGPDTPLRKVEVGKRSLLTVQRGNLLIALENEPSNPVEAEAWVGSLVSP